MSDDEHPNKAAVLGLGIIALATYGAVCLVLAMIGAVQ